MSQVPFPIAPELAGPDVAVPQIPDVFPGFASQFRREEERGGIARLEVNRIFGEQNELVNRVANADITEQSIIVQRAIGIPGVPSSFSEIRRRTGTEEAALAQNETDREAIRVLGEVLVEQLGVVQSSDWRLKLMQFLPAALSSTEVEIDTIDDVLGLVASDVFSPSVADRQFAEQLIEGISGLLPDVENARVTGVGPDGEPIVTIAVDTGELFADLQRRKGSKIIPFGNIQDMTTHELVQTIHDNARYSLPKPWTVDEAMEALRAEGLDQESINRVLVDIGPQVDVLVDELRESQSRMAVLRADAARFAGGEIDSKIDAALWGQAVQRPLLIVMKPFEYWHKYVISPLAGGWLLASGITGAEAGPVGGGVTVLRNILGVDSETDEQLRASFANARAEGGGYWNALSYSRENWDGNGLQKILLDSIVDPFSYLGFGLYAKPARALPYVGRWAGPGVGAVERGFTTAMELPFVVLKDLWVSAIPRTLQQRGLTLGNAAVDSARAYLEVVLGKQLVRMNSDEVVRVLTVQVDEAMRDPQNYTTRTGLFLLGDRELSVGDLRQYLDDVGVVHEITPAMLDEVSSIRELSKGFGATKWLLPDESSTLLMKALDVPPSTENLVRSVRYFNNMQAGMRVAALAKLRGNNIWEIMGSIQRGVQKDFVTAQQSLITQRRFQQGVVARSLDGLDTLARISHLNYLDEFVTRPFAKAYLMFGAYGLFNVLETMVKTMLAGVSPLWRRAELVYLKNAIRFGTRRAHVPLDVLHPQRLVIEAKFPEEELRRISPGVLLTDVEKREAEGTVDNWVTQLVTARWLRNIPVVRQPLEVLSGYKAASVFQGTAKANYYGRMFDKLVAEQDPEAVSAVVRLVDDLLIDAPEHVSAKYVGEYKNELVARLLTGDEAVVGRMPQDFSAGTVRAAEMSKIIDSLDIIAGDVGDVLMQKSASGELWAGGPAGVNRLFSEVLTEAIYARHLQSPELFRVMFGDMVDQVIDWVPVSAAEMNFKLNTIDQVVSTYGETITEAVNVARIYGERQTNPVEKGKFYDNFWDRRLSPHVNQSADDIGRMVTDMRDKLPSPVAEGTPLTAAEQQVLDDTGVAPLRLTSVQRLQYTQLLDKQLEVVAFTRNARNQQRAIERQLLDATPRNQRDRAWWDLFYFERSRPWVGVEDEFMRVRSQTFELSSQIEGLTAPFRLDARLNRPLVTKDVADLFGVAPIELARNMYLPQMLALKTKKNFVTLVRSRAERAGSEAGLDADALGYSEQALGRIYDSLVKEIKSNPDVMYGLDPAFNQLENARQEVIRLGGNRQALASDDTHDWLTDVLVGRQAVSEEVLPINPVTREASTFEELSQELLDLDDQVVAAETRLQEVLGTDDELFAAGLPNQLREHQVQINRAMVDAGIPAPEDWTARELLELGGYDPDFATARVERLRSQTRGRANVQRLFITELEGRGGDVMDRLSTVQIEERLGVNLPRIGGTEEIDEIPAIQILRDQIEADQRGMIETIVNIEESDIVAQQTAIRNGQVIAEREREAAIRLATQRAMETGLPTRVTSPAVESRLAMFRRVNPDTPDIQTLNRLIGPNGRPTTGHDQFLDDVMEQVNGRYGQDFPDYENLTAFSAGMRSIFPFWTYEAHRFAWYLPREALRHPGTYNAFGRYRDNSDQGYFHIPGTKLDINPLRGTILMGGMRRLSNRDYPEFYDQFGPAAGTFDMVSRAGFFPGFPIGLTFATFGAANGVTQFGELAPAWVKTMSGGLAVAVPGTTLDNFMKHIMPDRFRDFQQSRQVSANGYEGVELLSKKLRGEQFSDEEEQQWEGGSRGLGWFTVLAEQSALFRMNPGQRIETRAAADEVLHELTGVPLDSLRDLQRNNLRFEDVFGPLPPDIQKAVFEVEGFSKFSGASVALMPSQLGQQILVQREFWSTVEDNRMTERDHMARIETDVRNGTRSMLDWKRERSESIERRVNFIETKHREDRYRDIPLTLDERVAFAQENNMLEPILHPMEEMRELYFAEPLQERFNYETGQFEQDWDKFFAYREALEQSLPDEFLAELIRLNQAESTALELTHFQINKELFRAYHALFDVVLAEFDSIDQALIKEHRDTNTLRAQQIQETVIEIDGEQRQLISIFTSRLQLAHSNLRTANTELDAWLNVFREVRGFKTNAAERRFMDIRRELGIR
ncbi:hypothetical protein LCGC14_0818240 [marine sediment metagenome]|uniref:Large polyvalent protein associated domain-containing protein n=1 Tax=marine sediment metagenome TaxID=412755 RepID=A0A0F9PJK5_9ZZZZ